MGSLARAGRLGRRLGGGCCRRARAVGARLRHGRLDQAAGRAVRDRRAAADVRDGLTLRHRRVRVVARSGRADDEDGARLCAAVPRHRGARSERLDDGRRARGGAARARGPPRGAHRRPEADGRGGRDRAGRARDVRADARARAGARRRGGGVRAAAVGRLWPALLLPRRSGGGLVEPGALRRRALRPARRRRRLPLDGHAHARRGVRRRAEAPDHARHVRAQRRVLRRVLRTGAEGANDHPPRARGRIRAVRRARVSHVADGRLRARSEDAGPARDVRERPAHDPVVHGGAARPERAVRAVGRAARGVPDHRPAVRGEHALEKAVGFDVVPERLR
jgi:hypothetical protein